MQNLLNSLLKTKHFLMKDPCTMALETDQELMALYEKWDEQQVEEFFNDVDTMNIKCDEFNQEKFTV